MSANSFILFAWLLAKIDEADILDAFTMILVMIMVAVIIYDKTMLLIILIAVIILMILLNNTARIACFDIK